MLRGRCEAVRVAVAAVGVESAAGSGLETLATLMRSGGSGVGRVEGLPAPYAAAVPGLLPMVDGFADDRKVALLSSAVTQALHGAPDVCPTRRGVFLGTGLSSVTPRELAEDVYPHVRDGRVDRAACMDDLAADRVAPRRHLSARATGWVARSWGARGPVLTTFSACAAGAEAIAEGARAIERGDADVVLAGGHDSMLHPLGMLSFSVLGALAEGLGRPFDIDRDGFVLGEGAAVLRLERADRCARPLAWIIGVGSSLDAHGVTAPHPEGAGAEASMRRALASAALEPAEVDWINAHATGTPVGDAAEAMAAARVFGDRVPISSVKGAIGHTLAAAGAVEAAVSVAALRDGWIPGTVGCREAVAHGVRVAVQGLQTQPRVVLSNSFGFGGQNVSVVYAHPERL